MATRRLERFLAVMLPIALAFDGFYLATAILWHSVALAGGVGAVSLYVVALVWARRALGRGEITHAALVTGTALLVMVAIGAVFLHFQLAALVLIAIAAVVVVLPHITRPALNLFSVATLAVLVQIVVLGAIMPPLFPQPPVWFQHLVLTAAVIAAAAMIVLVLASDHQRMLTLVAAAHQLRTPVSTVLLQSETLLGQTAVGERTRPRLERLLRQATRLQHVVDSMLDVSRASAGTLQVERLPVDLAAIVRDVVARHDRAAQEAGVAITIDSPPALPMSGDPQRLTLITSHLLDNAIKFGGGSPVSVLLREAGTDVELAVRDRGAAIPAADRERWFAGRRPSSADGSLGVGLWLVREIAHAMGGDITTGDGPHGGTTLTVRVPRSPPP